MNYYLQHAIAQREHADDGWFEGDIAVIGADALPRIGESIEFKDYEYTVTHVFHQVNAAGQALQPIVRVR